MVTRLFSDKDEVVAHLPNTPSRRLPYSAGRVTKKLSFRKRISFLTNSAKTASDVTLKTPPVLPRRTCGGVLSQGGTQVRLRRSLTRRLRRYVKQGSKLKKVLWPVITWNVPSNGWSKKLANAVVNKTLEKAFRMWAEVTPLRFRWVDEGNSPVINITFSTGEGSPRICVQMCCFCWPPVLAPFFH